MRRPILLGSAIALAIALASPLWACSIPVFRYALERWQADPYQVAVYYRGELDSDSRELVERIAAFEEPDHEAPGNTQLRLVDLATATDEELLDAWEAQATDELPWMVVQHRDAARQVKQVWASRFDASQVDLLLTSPVREELASRLLSGDSAVWLFLESGDAEKDAAAVELLERRIAALEQELTLPELAAEDLDQGLMELDPAQLKLSFSLIRLSRDDPAEAGLVEMLLETEHDLREFDGEPMAFPVFGRGRVLYALIGAGINEETIGRACEELIGPCTCQVKDQNPGSDLLMSVAWDRLVTPSAEEDRSLPTLPGLPSLAVYEEPADLAEPPRAEQQDESREDEEMLVAAADVSPQSESTDRHTAATPPPSDRGILSNVAWLAVAAFLSLSVASVVLVMRRGRSAAAR